MSRVRRQVNEIYQIEGEAEYIVKSRYFIKTGRLLQKPLHTVITESAKTERKFYSLEVLYLKLCLSKKGNSKICKGNCYLV